VPNFTWVQSIPANSTFDSLSGWQYEYAPFGGTIEIVHNANAVGTVATISAGSDTLQERSPVSAGGTPGTLPSALDQLPIMDDVAAGDRLKIQYENTTGGAITVNGTIVFQPGH
jgi:hypothetical protein